MALAKWIAASGDENATVCDITYDDEFVPLYMLTPLVLEIPQI